MKEVKGDLIQMAKDGQFDVIMHGCNCQSIMGAGFAKQVRENFIEAEKADKFAFASAAFARELLGSYSIGYETIENKILRVINLYTQLKPGANFELQFLDSALEELKVDSRIKFADKIGIPHIGAGLGGGNWEEIKSLLESKLSMYNVTIVKYQKEKKK